ncbi:hypothetical protein QCA50_019685 [Cerrena zonata]|uniref:Uncharacterized protein n=1 Tax=Cerrena zonata TaxID=2478898 RepID=A0AAW0F8R4_9APHY
MFELVDDPRDIRPPEPEPSSVGDDWVIVEDNVSNVLQLDEGEDSQTTSHEIMDNPQVTI